MLACFAELERSAAHIELACHNRIPHGRGLGSSAAAIVAGVLAARELAGAAERFDDDAVLALAAGVEGHPDNVAPCLLGGLTIAWADRGGVVKAIRDDVHASVRPVLFVPEVSVKTDVARGLLPAQVPHADAVYNAGRAALLVEAMTRRPDLLFDATEERLHQSYRQPAMPGTIELLSALRHKGHAAVISGAGPSVLVLAGDTDLGSADVGDWNTLSLDIAAGGAHVAHE
jgi:homoserine kinase